MKRMMEKLLAAMLASTLAVSSVPAAAFAQEAAPANQEQAAIEVIDEASGEVKVGLDVATAKPAEAEIELDKTEVELAEAEAKPAEAEAELDETRTDVDLPKETTPAEEGLNQSAEPSEAEAETEAAFADDAEPQLQELAEDPAQASADDPEPSHDIANAVITIPSQTYTGAELYPEPVVMLNGIQLNEGLDYDCNYVDAYVNAGTYTVTFVGAGDYTGQATATFTIKPRAISKVWFGSISARTYTGKAIKPVPEITDWDEDLCMDVYLVRGTDYTLSYKSNTKVGTASVVVRGKGNYTGTKTLKFKINAASIGKASVAKIATQKWTGKAIKPKLVVKFDGKTLKAGTDYTLAYKNNVKAGGTATITIKGKGNFKGTKTVTFKIGAKTGTWKQSGGRWWYRFADGSYPKSKFERISGTWYYFDGSGWMVTGWQSVGGTWYYFNDSGAMVTGWRSIGGSWYYFDSSGAMARNRWVGDYYLGSSGAMLTSTTTPDGYRVGSDGKWIRDSGGSSGGSGSYGTVYWVDGGEVWHSTPSCPSLSRSHNIRSGTIAQSGKSRGCHNCT